MNILAVDTSARVMAVVIVRDMDEVGVVLDAGVTHSETLMPTIDKVLREHDLSLDDIDAYAVDVGPGSFTGIRIGVNTINALAYARGKGVVSFDSFEANTDYDETAICAIDCRHSNYYVKSDGVLSVREGSALVDARILDSNRISVVSVAKAVRSNASHLSTQAIPEYVRESEAERNL